MDETREELELSMADGNAVRTMVNGKGWQTVVRPALDARKDYLVAQMCDATEFSDFVRIQQAVNAIKNLIAFVETTLTRGDEAHKELRENP
jgi:hypothetical protein